MKTFRDLKEGDYLYGIFGDEITSRNPTIYEFYDMARIRKYVILRKRAYFNTIKNEEFVEFKCSLIYGQDMDYTIFMIPVNMIDTERYFRLYSDPNSIINKLNFYFNKCIGIYKWRLDREKEISILMPIEMKVRNMDLYSSTKRKLLNLGRALTDNVTIGTLSPFVEESDELIPF